MPHSVTIDNDLIAIRRDWADHAVGDAMRRPYRDRVEGPRDLTRFHNEAFSFTPDEYELLKKIRPDLFDGSPQDKQKRWAQFAQSSEGKAFRIK